MFDIGNATVKKVQLLDPLKGTEALVGPLLERAGTVEELLATIST